jgi:stearoyl-CoA desaturase (delta-9 desaturase)
MPSIVSALAAPLRFAVRWFDSWAVSRHLADKRTSDAIDWARVVPFLVLHLACFAVVWVGVSPVAVLVAVGLYVVRMFALTGFYHRYFSHRAFKTSRPAQFAFALLGATAVQRGPLWWAAHHRHHHRYSDGPEDVHSPVSQGFLRSQMTWVMDFRSQRTKLEYVKDLAKFPELVFLDRFDTLVPILLGAALFGTGALLEAVAPGLGTNGPQMFVWGFVISTVFLFHATSTINSLSHMIGTRPYETTDRSRNNPVLALLTLGEGWHNNHHRYQSSVRQGFRWWQVDLTWYGLLVLKGLGLIWDLRPVPAKIVAEGRRRAA